jgi:hypothetical protein
MKRHFQSDADAAAELVEDWLTLRLLREPTTCSAHCQSALDRLASVPACTRALLARRVLEDRPALAGAVHRLTLLDQLRVSVELARGTCFVYGDGRSVNTQRYGPGAQILHAQAVSRLGSAQRCASQHRGRCHIRRRR